MLGRPPTIFTRSNFDFGRYECIVYERSFRIANGGDTVEIPIKINSPLKFGWSKKMIEILTLFIIIWFYSIHIGSEKFFFFASSIFLSLGWPSSVELASLIFHYTGIRKCFFFFYLFRLVPSVWLATFVYRFTSLIRIDNWCMPATENILTFDVAAQIHWWDQNEEKKMSMGISASQRRVRSNKCRFTAFNEFNSRTNMNRFASNSSILIASWFDIRNGFKWFFGRGTADFLTIHSSRDNPSSHQLHIWNEHVCAHILKECAL